MGALLSALANEKYGKMSQAPENNLQFDLPHAGIARELSCCVAMGQ
jgi:hypothetical protein